MRFTKKLMSILVCAIIITSLALSGCNNTPSTTGQSSSSSAETEEKVLIYGLGSTWNRLMPYDLNGMYMVIPNEKIFDKLTYYTDDGVELRAAESITMEDEGKTFVVKLKQNSKFHDGQPVTTDDWVWTFQTISDPDFPMTASKSYLNNFTGTDATGNVEPGKEIGIEAVDKYTMKLYLKEATTPESFFMAYCNYFYVLPKHLLEDIPVAELNDNEFWENPIGSGPCKFVSQVSGNELVLEAYDDYYMGRPNFDKLIYKVVEATAFPNLLLSGSIDVCYPAMTPGDALYLDGQNGLHADKSLSNTTNHMISINNAKFSPEVRRAFSLLIDKQMILDNLLSGEGVVAETYVLPTSKYANKDLKFERDVEEAKKILQEQNFDFSATYTIGTSNELRNKIAAIVQENFAEAGIKLEIVSGDSTGMLAAAKSGDVDMNIMSWTSNASPTYNIAYHNTNEMSFSRVQDSKYFETMTAVNMEQDEAKRIEMMQDFQVMYQQECPYIPLFHQYVYIVQSARVHGIGEPKVDTCWTWEIS